MRGGVPRHPFLERGSPVLPSGACHAKGAMQKESNAQQKDASWLVASDHSWRGQISMAAGGTSFPEGPNMDTNGHLGPRRILALTSEAGDLNSAPAERASHALAP